MRLLAAEIIQHKQPQSQVIYVRKKVAIKVYWLATLLIRPTGTFWHPNLQPTKFGYFSFVWPNRRTNILYFIRMLVTSHFPLSLTNQTQFPSQRCHLKQTLLIYPQSFKQKNKYSLFHSNARNMSLTSVVNKPNSISCTKMSF